MWFCVGMVGLVLGVGTAHAAEPAGPDADIVWKPRAVRYPALPSEVRAEAPFVTREARSIAGPVEIGPDRAAVLWVDALDVVRVRRVDALSGETGGRAAKPAARRGGDQEMASRGRTNEPGTISLLRVVGGRGRAAMAERAVSVEPGIWHIAQPPAHGDVWVISAPRPMTVVVEYPTQAQSSALWEAIRTDILRWVDEDGEVPRIPMVSGGSELQLRLRADRAIGRLLGVASPRGPDAGRGSPAGERIERAVRAWRKASALALLDAVGSRWQPYHQHRSFTRTLAEQAGKGRELTKLATAQGTEIEKRSDRPYAHIDADRSVWKLELSGPGILEIDLRALVGEAGRHEERTLTVHAVGRMLAHRGYYSREARVRAPDSSAAAAFPRRVQLITEARELVGLRERVRVPLLSGAHVYTIELEGGPSLIRARTVQRRPRLMEFLQRRASPDDWIAQAGRVLAGDTSDEGKVLRVLLDTLRGAQQARTTGMEPSPSLHRLVAEVERLRGRPVEPVKLRELLAWALPVLDAWPRDADPALGWMLRRDLARMAVRARAPELMIALASAAQIPDAAAAATARPTVAVTAPPPILAELATLRLQVDLAPEGFFWSLTAVHHAWQQAPLDLEVRRAYARIWHRGGAWSRLEPILDPFDATTSLPAQRYLRIESAPVRCEGKGPLVMGPRDLWRAQMGEQHRVLAPPSPFDRRRPVLLRAYVLVPPAARGAVALHVDDRVFHAVSLEPVEILSVAVSPGEHDVRVEGPPGTETYLSLGPATPPAGGMVQRARLRWIRPVGSNPSTMHYILPASSSGGPLRIDLRAVVSPDRPESAPLRVTVRTDAGPARTLMLDTRTTDPMLVALDGAPALSPLVQAVVWVPPAATQIWFETEPGAHILARIAVRQRHADVPASGAGAAVAAPTADNEDSMLTGEDSPGQEHGEAETWSHDDPRWETITDEIAILSRQLAASPDDAELLIRRANRLLDIGQGGHARADVARLNVLDARHWTPAQNQARARLDERLDAWRDNRYLPVQPRGMTHPIPIAPGSLALAGSADDVRPWIATAHAVRTRHDRTLLYRAAQRRDSLLARYYRADMLMQQGDYLDAARALREIYEETGQPQIGIEALLAFEAALAQDVLPSVEPAARVPPGASSLAYGLALELRERLVHPVVERVLFAVARQSRWEPIRNTDANAGFERLYLDQGESEPGPITEVKRSLLAAPWPGDDIHVVDPGRGALLHVDLARPATIRPQVWCRRIRSPEEESPAHCAVRWRVNGQPLQTTEVPLVSERTLDTLALGNGRHQISVSLAEEDPSMLMAVRFVANRPLNQETNDQRETTVPVLRPGRLFVADAERPVVITVLGPTTLRVEARRYDGDPPVLVDIDAEPEGVPEGKRRSRSLLVDAPRDDAATSDAGRQVRLSLPVRTTIVLPEHGPYRVVTRPRSGHALVRFGRREDQEPASSSIVQPARPAEDAQPAQEATPAVAATPWPAQSLAEDGLSGRTWQPDRTPPWPTLSAGLQYRRDDLEERDVTDEPLENRFQLDVAWRRQVVDDKLWVRVRPSLRWHPGLTPSYGVAGDLDLRRLPYGLGVDLSSRLFAQSVEGVLGWSVQGQIRVTRPLRASTSLTLLPSLGLRARHYSLTSADTAPFAFDPLVYNGYSRTHRYAIEPRLRAYWWAFQDQMAFATAQLVTNESLRTTDHVRLGIGWRGILEWQRIGEPLFQVEYGPNLRLFDEHRGSTYLRHDLELGLEWSLWNGSHGRLVLELRDDLYLSNLGGHRNVFLVGIRYDFTGGRGLRDILPSERRFNDLIEQGQWAD